MRSLIPKLGLCSLICAVLCPALSAQQATIKCWTDENGVRTCGNSLPPEAAQRGYERRHAGGSITLDAVGAARPKEEIDAERAAAAEAEERARRAEQLRLEQYHRDTVLLNTFATEAELLSARDGQLEALDSRLQHTGAVIDRLAKSAHALEVDAARAERAGKVVDDALIERIDAAHAQVDQQQVQSAELVVERKELETRFETDLARYRKLTGGG